MDAPVDAPDDQRSRRGYFSIGLAAAAWGTWTVFLRRAEQARAIAPALQSFVILCIISVLLLPQAIMATRRRTQHQRSADWYLLAAFGISDALNCTLYFAALQRAPVAVGVLTHYIAPLLVAVAAPFMLKEKRRRGTLGTLALGLFGLLLLLSPWKHFAGRGDQQLMQGALLGLGSALFYAASMLFNKHLSRTFAPSELIVYHMPSALVLLAALVPSGQWVLSPMGFTWLALGAVGPGALAGVMFVHGLRLVTASRAAVLTLLEPVTALLIAAFAWHEPIGALGYAGAVAVLTAGYLVMKQDLPPDRRMSSMPGTEVDSSSL